MRRTLLAVIVFTTLTAADDHASAQDRFPSFAVEEGLGLSGAWELAEAVVVGDLRNPREFGVQHTRDLPSPYPAGSIALYWCQAELSIVATVRGETPRVAKYVWASAIRGCKIPRWSPAKKGQPLTRIWFLREDGPYLRPVVDYSQGYFYEAYIAWSSTADPPPLVAFARSLLTLNIKAVPAQESDDAFYTPATIACYVLGDEECLRRIRDLAMSENPRVRLAANAFLNVKAHW